MSSCRSLVATFSRLRLIDVGVGSFDHVISNSARLCAPANAQRPLATTATACSVSPSLQRFQDACPPEMRQLQPYRRAKRPKPWPEILLGIELNAARNRPINKNRKNFDRQIAKQIQIAVRLIPLRIKLAPVSHSSTQACCVVPERCLEKERKQVEE